MADVNEVLNKLTEERQTYPDFVAAVDADLKIERLRRLAVRQGTIMHLVAEARALGASKRAIMRAYGTKDFNTIAKILAAMEEQVAQMQAESQEAVERDTDWFDLASRDVVFIGEFGYEITELELDEYMLIQMEGQPTEWDGYILTAGDSTKRGSALYEAVSGSR